MDPRRLNFRGPRGWIEALGLAALALASCLAFYGRVLTGRARFDLPAFAAALQQSGLSILPAITLVMAAIGLILGHQVEVVHIVAVRAESENAASACRGETGVCPQADGSLAIPQFHSRKTVVVRRA